MGNNCIVVGREGIIVFVLINIVELKKISSYLKCFKPSS